MNIYKGLPFGVGHPNSQTNPWLCQATTLLKGTMRSWICGVCAHVASPFRRSRWLRKRLRKDEVHELCLSSVKVPTSFTSYSDFFGASEYWFADSLAVLKRLQQCNLLNFTKHYEAFKWLAELPCYDAFHWQPQARNNSDLFRSGYAGLIAKIRCSFLLGCCGFWIRKKKFAMQALHAVRITDHYWPICMLGLASCKALNVWMSNIQELFATRTFAFLQHIIYMHLIFQGALNFPGSSFIAAETAAEARGTFELCGLGVELRQIQKVLNVLSCTMIISRRNSSLLFR